MFESTYTPGKARPINRLSIPLSRGDKTAMIKQNSFKMGMGSHLIPGPAMSESGIGPCSNGRNPYRKKQL